jgi:hypothetical protein
MAVARFLAITSNFSVVEMSSNQQMRKDVGEWDVRIRR